MAVAAARRWRVGSHCHAPCGPHCPASSTPPSCAPSLIPTYCPQVQIQASFRPGDVVRAEVLSLGDARSYHLTTAKNELGVVYAKSVAGTLEGWWGGGTQAGVVSRMMKSDPCVQPACTHHGWHRCLLHAGNSVSSTSP